MCIVHFSREVEAEFKAHFSLEIDRFTLPACIENATVRRTLCAAAPPRRRRHRRSCRRHIAAAI